MQDDTRHGVDHGGESSDRKDITGDFDGAFFRGTLDFLNALGVGHRADVPDVGQNIARVGGEKGGELSIAGPGTGQRVFIDVARGFVEKKRDRRDIGLGAIEADVALALLLGIVEGMRVEK